MAINKPFKRTVRQLMDNTYSGSGNSGYIMHKDYANSPEKYIRSFLLIQDDLQKLFEYIDLQIRIRKPFHIEYMAFLSKFVFKLRPIVEQYLLKMDIQKKIN